MQDVDRAVRKFPLSKPLWHVMIVTALDAPPLDPVEPHGALVAVAPLPDWAAATLTIRASDVDAACTIAEALFPAGTVDDYGPAA